MRRNIFTFLALGAEETTADGNDTDGAASLVHGPERVPDVLGCGAAQGVRKLAVREPEADRIFGRAGGSLPVSIGRIGGCGSRLEYIYVTPKVLLFKNHLQLASVDDRVILILANFKLGGLEWLHVVENVVSVVERRLLDESSSLKGAMRTHLECPSIASLHLSLRMAAHMELRWTW
ncbi:hypothetical protein EXIGLDRAFT_778731 [Exidia glandulosa HHB12029]|uniref:Uncharacterized protein n=1 Tax=Exidia glandulosa HHB12029 TaxID=1314781 RepID=A0A165CE44_EXIGL|nr:hypothetical protein EXIGLDRAFT_778731 [Exidia glandulosa HHB12029]